MSTATKCETLIGYAFGAFARCPRMLDAEQRCPDHGTQVVGLCPITMSAETLDKDSRCRIHYSVALAKH